MENQSGPLEAEDRFFAALLESDGGALDRVLSDDFIMIDVMRGGQIQKQELLAVVTSRQLRFESIRRFDPRVRIYGMAAVITGSTLMTMRFEETQFQVNSRYTHIFVHQDETWRLASAQGTRIESDGRTGA
jgi:hypothetical protein